MKLFLPATFLGSFLIDLPARSPGTYFEKEIIYGRKDGLALTMHMLVPKTGKNGKVLISLVNGGWYSQEKWIRYYIELVMNPAPKTEIPYFKTGTLGMTLS